MPKRQRLAVEEIGDETLIHFADPRILDKPNIEAIFDEVFHLVNYLGRRKLRLDFANVEYLSSAALGKLVSLHKKLLAEDGALILSNVPDGIYRVFEIAGLETMFDIQRAAAEKRPAD